MNPPKTDELNEYRIWARYVVPATRLLMDFLGAQDAVQRLAFERFESGLQVFGLNQRWGAMSSPELRFESLEEMADALNYMIWHLYLEEHPNG